MPSSNITDAVFQACVSKKEAAENREAFTKKELEATERKLRKRICSRMAYEVIVSKIQPDYQSCLEIEERKNELRDMERELRRKKQRLTAMAFMSRYSEDNPRTLSPALTTASPMALSSTTQSPKTPKPTKIKKVIEVETSDDDDNNKEDFYGSHDYEDEEPMCIDDSSSKQQQFSFNFAGK